MEANWSEVGDAANLVARRLAASRSRLATLTNTDRVTADGAVRTASATMAWFFRSRPTDRTLTGAATRPVGF